MGETREGTPVPCVEVAEAEEDREVVGPFVVKLLLLKFALHLLLSIGLSHTLIILER